MKKELDYKIILKHVKEQYTRYINSLSDAISANSKSYSQQREKIKQEFPDFMHTNNMLMALFSYQYREYQVLLRRLDLAGIDVDSFIKPPTITGALKKICEIFPYICECYQNTACDIEMDSKNVPIPSGGGLPFIPIALCEDLQKLYEETIECINRLSTATHPLSEKEQDELSECQNTLFQLQLDMHLLSCHKWKTS